MHDPQQAAGELTRAVKELGMFGGLVNDFQSTGEDGSGKEYYDTEKYLPFWKVVEEVDVPIYFHPRWPPPREFAPNQPYGARKHLLGAAVSFHLDLSFHIYAMCASGSCFATASGEVFCTFLTPKQGFLTNFLKFKLLWVIWEKSKRPTPKIQD